MGRLKLTMLPGRGGLGFRGDFRLGQWVLRGAGSQTGSVGEQGLGGGGDDPTLSTGCQLYILHSVVTNVLQRTQQESCPQHVLLCGLPGLWAQQSTEG